MVDTDKLTTLLGFISHLMEHGEGGMLDSISLNHAFERLTPARIAHLHHLADRAAYTAINSKKAEITTILDKDKWTWTDECMDVEEARVLFNFIYWEYTKGMVDALDEWQELNKLFRKNHIEGG